MTSIKKYGNSSFWMDRFHTTEDVEASSNEIHSNYIYKLASQRRAIANFVSIVTNQQIPVKFATSGDSYTDGKMIVISSKLEKESEFDVAVGLALHEGSHIKLSDFTLLQKLNNVILQQDDYARLYELSAIADAPLLPTIKDILNWVEDRRIDNYIYSNSPGYRLYYQSLYDKYFNDPLIDKALSSNEMTSEDINSYMFRLINLHSKYTRLNALKGLRGIWKTADLSRIDRLVTTTDALTVAINIFKVICESIEAEKQNQKYNSPEQPKADVESNSSTESGDDGGSNSSTESGDEDGDGSTSEMDDESFEKLLDSIIPDDGNSDDDSNGVAVDNFPDTETSSSSNSDGGTADVISLTDRQRDILKKKIEKQKSFIRGDITNKSKLSKESAKLIDILESSGAELVEVGSNYDQSAKRIPTVSCILVKNMTMGLIERTEFPLSSTNQYCSKTKSYITGDSSRSAVDSGIRLGTILGKKMQVRSESKDTIFNRQLNGKLDKRMVASLGYGNSSAFYTKETDVYNKVNLHISVDSSSSMNTGGKWNKTITNVVALAKAVDMIANLEVQISFRSTDYIGNPYIVIAYDSRKDKFSKIKQLFPYLRPYGTTPEGLCFDAIQKYMISSSNGLDSYFLNISDGEPYWVSPDFLYGGKPAAIHTKKMMDGYRKLGIHVLSYYMGTGAGLASDRASLAIFTESYGKSAKYIDVTSATEVSKTMNELFMKK